MTRDPPPTSPTADEPPGLDDLARRTLDLWQDQWAAMCADSDLADAMARTLHGLGQSAGPRPFLRPCRSPRSEDP